MRRFNHTIFVVILLYACSFSGKRATARIFIGYGAESPSLAVNQHWTDYIQRSCRKELAEVEKELEEYDLYFPWKVTGANKESTIRLTKWGSLPTAAQEAFLGCINNDYRIFRSFSEQYGLPFTQSVPRRYLMEKSSGVPSSSGPSTSNDVFDKPLYIPPELLPQPPPPPPPPPSLAATRSSAQEQHNKEINKIITIAASIAGLVVIFALVLFCCLLRGSRTHSEYKQRDDKPLLTLSSSDFSAGSSWNSDTNDVGRNTSFNGSSQKSDGLHATLAGISEHGKFASENADALSQEPPPGKTDTPAPPPAAPPPPPPRVKPTPPPPPKGARPPPAPPHHRRCSMSGGDGTELAGNPYAPRTKLKPFFWDKVVGSPDHSMVWDEIRAGSFQFNEEMIESLFGYNPDDKRNGDRRSQSSSGSQPQQIQIIDPKKSQNLSILLKALNVTTEEVHDALLEGNELPTELLQTLLRMAPTQEEELKLRLFSGDSSILGPAERFLKVLVEIPFAFKRMESLMFMMTFKEEVSSIKESFLTLQVACDELKKSRLFLKLLEAVLKTGNRMNDGTYRGGAQAFKLDTLLKLADVKGTDGKTTLLHFVVQEIIRTEGMKALRAAKENRSISSMKSEDFVEDPCYDATEQYRTLGLQIVSSISSELENVKKAAVIDADGLTTTVTKLGQSLTKVKNFLNNDMENSEEDGGFCQAVASFLEHSDAEVTWLVEEEQRITQLVRRTADYFHGNSGREEGLRLFVIVRDFLLMLDKICVEVKLASSKRARSTSKEKLTKATLQDQQQSIHDMRQRLFPAIADRRVGDSSSDSDDDSSD